ncbi:sulfatase-like hydrolase/transferase [Luteolibacter sp. AS25]|uniref:sulfatase-like hydrolase/transferase n=1 Tax=Luteolibacter sp. AS25 TaxID=3135776 RepID=UPI00398B7789
MKLKNILLFAVLPVAMVSSMQAAETAPPVKKPNIVFIYADDWGWGDLSCHGSEWLETPHIDRLAAEGTDFQAFNVLSPVCSPSRVSALTGRYPSRYGINSVFGGKRLKEMPAWLDGRAPTIPRFLKTVGYTTGHFGKWHMGSSGPTMAEYGIDESAVYGGPGPGVAKDGNEIADLSVQFIEDHKDVPFYLNVWLHESHLDHTPSKESLALWREKETDEKKQVYGAVITDGDNKVGMVLDALDRAGIADNTIVVFSSDNGPERPGTAKGKEGAWRDYYSIGETGGRRGAKRSLYEGGVGVPFIVRWPGVTPAGAENLTTPISSVDLLPTFCAVAGVVPPESAELDGENMIEALRGKEIERTKPLFWLFKDKGGEIEEPHWWASLAVRDGDWKLLCSFDGKRAELYNLKESYEQDKPMDKASENPEITARLTKMATEWYATLPMEADPTTRPTKEQKAENAKKAPKTEKKNKKQKKAKGESEE